VNKKLSVDAPQTGEDEDINIEYLEHSESSNDVEVQRHFNTGSNGHNTNANNQIYNATASHTSKTEFFDNASTDPP